MLCNNKLGTSYYFTIKTSVLVEVGGTYLISIVSFLNRVHIAQMRRKYNLYYSILMQILVRFLPDTKGLDLVYISRMQGLKRYAMP